MPSAQCNDDFHAAVLAASGSARLPVLVAVVSSAPLVRRVLHSYDDDDRRRSVMAHRDVITAIANGDADLATSAMSSHILAARYSALRSLARPTPCPTEDTVMDDRRHTLRHFPVVRTTSVDEARDAVTDVYLPHALRADGGRLRMRLNAARQRRFTLGFLAYGAHAELGMPATETTYHVNLTTRGTTYAERGDGTRAVTAARTSGVVLLPDQFNTVRWTDDAEQLILKIPRTRLESHLADLVGRPVDKPVDFRFGFSTATGRGRSLLATVEFLARELDRPGGIAETPLAREQLEAFVMTQVLLAAPNSYSDVLEGYVAHSCPSRLQAVLTHMETHADQPLTPGELARIGCMSVRSLHATFQRELGLSPMAHLRRVRLDHVHAELLRAGDSDGRGSATSPCAGLLPPEPVRPPVPGAVRRAPLRHDPPRHGLSYLGPAR